MKGKKKGKKGKKLKKRLKALEKQQSQIVDFLWAVSHHSGRSKSSNWLQENASGLIELGTEVVRGFNRSKAEELYFTTKKNER